MRKEMMQRCLLVCAAIGLASGASGQEAVSFAPNLSEGQQFTYEIAMRLRVRQTTGDAQANEASTTSTATMRFTVIEITEGGSARVEMMVRTMRLDNEIEGDLSGYGWPLAVDLLVDDSGMARLGETLAGETIELHIANSGEVTVVSALDSFVDAAQEIAGSKAHLLLGLFNPNTLGATLTPLFVIDGARATDRDLDDQWQVTRQMPFASVGMMRLESSFTFTSFEDGIASYTGTSSFSIAASEDDQDVRTAIKIVAQSGETNGTFDTVAGLLRTRSRTMSVRTRWSLGDITMEQMQDSMLSFTLIEED